jgi:hypothetical protein
MPESSDGPVYTPRFMAVLRDSSRLGRDQPITGSMNILDYLDGSPDDVYALLNRVAEEYSITISGKDIEDVYDPDTSNELLVGEIADFVEERADESVRAGE